MKKVNINMLPDVGVSHHSEIKKRVMIDKGDIPQLTAFSKAVFLPGQKVDDHAHATMYEVFYILSGKANFTVNGDSFIVQAGDCITIEPGEVHAQSNPFQEKVEWVYFGIATEKP